MWKQLLRAEIYKIVGHLWVTGCTVWIFPATMIVFTPIVLVLMVFMPSLKETFFLTPPLWTSAMVNTWNLATNPIGRLLLAGFAAVFFAGEYHWDTWKNLVPRNRRIPLILVKFTAQTLVILFAFNLAGIIWAIGQGFLAEMTGYSYGPAPNSAVLRQFAEDYALQMFTTSATVFIAAGMAALAAMLTRSVLGSVIVALIISAGESLLIGGLHAVSWLLHIDEITHLYRLTPTYNLSNITSWITEKAPLPTERLLGFHVEDNLAFSLMILAIWAIGLVGLTATLFYHQDIAG